MTAVWSFRNAKGSISRTDIILSVFSVIMWKRAHPEHTTKIYIDADYASLLKNLNLLEFWDEHKLLQSRTDIDLEKFWAISKFEAIQNEEGPVIHVDGDLIAYTNLQTEGLFDGDLAVTLLEEIKDSEDIAYGDSEDVAEFGGIQRDMFDWDDYADQTSISYWNNDEFKDEYLKYVFDYAVEVSKKEDSLDINPLAYILFIEQKFYRELAKERGMVKTYLISDAYKVSNGLVFPSEETNGIYPYSEVTNYVVHYGPGKREFDSDLEMALHLSQFIIPTIGEEYSPWFWNIYSQMAEDDIPIEESTPKKKKSFFNIFKSNRSETN